MKKSLNSRISPENERIKYQYYRYLEQAAGRDVRTVDAVARAIERYEAYTDHRSFALFDIEEAMRFKASLLGDPSEHTGRTLEKSTALTILLNLRSFFVWLGGQPGYKSRIPHGAADYFNMSDKDVRAAHVRREKRVPSLDQMDLVLNSMPTSNAIERRNQAVIAFMLLTGVRIAAAASLKLQDVDLEARRVFQDPRHVKTKFSKTIHTWFFPVGPKAEEIVRQWIGFLRKEVDFTDADPLFPSTLITGGAEQMLLVRGLSRKHWADTTGIRKIFQNAFQAAGLPYFNPHSLRDTLARLGEQVTRSPEEFYAWALNLGHESMMTTFQNYGSVPLHRRDEIFRDLTERALNPAAGALTPEQEGALRQFRKVFPALG